MKHWRYAGASVDRQGWFVAFVDEVGCVAVLSDFGDYAYRWGGVPREVGIRRFLTQCERSYVLDKFTYGKKEFDEERTRASALEAILEERYAHRCAAEEAREVFDEVTSAVGEHEMTNAIGAAHFGLLNLAECWCTGPTAQHRAFVDQIWPRLMKEIEADLEREAQIRARWGPPSVAP